MDGSNNSLCPRVGWCEKIKETTVFCGDTLLRTEISTATEFAKNAEATIPPAGKWMMIRFYHCIALFFAHQKVVEWDLTGIYDRYTYVIIYTLDI